MKTITIMQFQENFSYYLDKLGSNKTLAVSRDNGKDFVVMSRRDWQSLNETLYVLQNPSLMLQIQTSCKTHHKQAKGYQP